MLKMNFFAWLFLFGCGLLLPFFVNAADIQVSVDRNPVNLNESFQITFSSNESPDDDPDFSELQANFDILNQQHSNSMSLINGKTSRNEQWMVSVMAKQTGELLIPPVAFGSDSSQPLKITVRSAPQTTTHSEEVFLEVQALPENPYVQSQVLYTLKLFRRVQISQASLNEPDVKDAVVEKLGEDSTYSTQLNGLDYWVTERRYAIFPQQSGSITIAPLTLTAEVVSNQRPRFNGFFTRQMTETHRVSSRAITLDVQPAPPSFAGKAWLSAESLELQQSWSDNRLQSPVGEPLTRTLTLTVKGATVGQLPELSGQVAIDGIKTYPDQPVLKEEKLSDGLQSIREEKIAYIASKPGEYTLPGMSIEWFNTKTQQVEQAHLPEVRITAKGTAATAPTPPAPVPVIATPTTQSEPLTSDPSPAANPLIWQGLAGFLALGWLLHALWFYRYRGLKKSQEPEKAPQKPLQDEFKTLKTACLQSQPQAAKMALLAWGKQQFAVDNLDAIAQCCDLALAAEIRRLNQCLYAPAAEDWSGQALWHAFSRFKVESRFQSKQSDLELEPLYRL